MATEITAKKILSEREISNLKETLGFASKRDQLIIDLLMSFGMRGAELRDIKREDLNIEEGSLFVRGKKRSRDREFPIESNLLARLEAFVIENRIGRHKPIFEVSESGLKFIWNRLRPCKKGIHSLRHTFAVKLYERTRDVKVVQLFLGHRSISSTQVYIDFVYSRSKMQKVLQGDLYVN